MNDISCAGCTAKDGRSAKQKGHPDADKYGWVSLCQILREEGTCKMVLAKRWLDLQERQRRLNG